MRIAFDCSGTLIRNFENSKDIAEFFRWLQSEGHEVVIWSNSFDYALQAKEEHKLEAECMMKFCKFDEEDKTKWFDVAIDDDMSQTYLAAKSFISASDIPSDGEYKEFFERMKNG